MYESELIKSLFLFLLYVISPLILDGSPKNENFITYTHPHVVPNLFEFLSSVEHKRKKL